MEFNLFINRTKYFWGTLRFVIAMFFLFIALYSFYYFPFAVNYFIGIVSLIITATLIYISRKEAQNKIPFLPLKIFVGIISILFGIIICYYGLKALNHVILIGLISVLLSVLLILYGIFEIKTAK
jgi:hypothetical protein